MRVRHRETGAAGRVKRSTDVLYPGDRQGPWHLVAFEDGFECWVPQELVTEVPGPRTLTVGQLIAELQRHDPDAPVTVATDSWWLNVSGAVSPAGGGPPVVIETTDDFDTRQF